MRAQRDALQSIDHINIYFLEITKQVESGRLNPRTHGDDGWTSVFANPVFFVGSCDFQVAGPRAHCNCYVER